MGIQIVTMMDCASNYGVFQVSGNSGGYIVSLHGSEGPAHCTCPAFKFSGSKMTCKHLKKVMEQACLYNPQWHEGRSTPDLRPVSYTYERFATGETCICGGPMVYVRRAV